MRIFLDANVLFSAAKSNGAVRQLLADLHAEGHTLVADGYVAVEAQRNIATKSTAGCLDYLRALLSRIEVHPGQYAATPGAIADWLPAKDRPVLIAAIACRCDVLVTGDRTHFGAGYGSAYEGVVIHSPAQLALALWAGQLNRPADG